MRGDGMRPGGHRPGNKVEIRRPRAIEPPSPPEGLGERGLIEWHKIWKAGEHWLHPNEDYHWVEQIARAYDDITHFRAEIENNGMVVKGYAGQMTASPMLREIREAQSVIRRCLSQLGFSPADRVKIGLAEVQRQTGVANLQAKTAKKRSGER